jgi:WXG100 family type VII secretion target
VTRASAPGIFVIIGRGNAWDDGSVCFPEQGVLLGELQVDPAHVASVAGDLRAVVEETRTGLSTLDGQLSGLLGAGWTGQAGSAFGDVWQRWHEGAAELVKGLDTMAGLLEEAAHSYHQTDMTGGAAIDGSGM